MSHNATSLTGTWLFVVALFGSVSCNGYENVIPQPTVPRSARSVTHSLQGRSPVTLSQALAIEEHEFGGAYFENGVMYVYITDLGLRTGVEGPLRASIMRMRPGAHVVVRRGKFSYQQLQEYSEALGPYYRPAGVAYTRIDDRTNQLHIGVVDEQTRARLANGIKALGLDPEAIVLELAKYIELTATHSLTDQFRPLWGGLQRHASFRCGRLDGASGGAS